MRIFLRMNQGGTAEDSVPIKGWISAVSLRLSAEPSGCDEQDMLAWACEETDIWRAKRMRDTACLESADKKAETSE